MRFPTAGFRAPFLGESRGLHMRRFGLLGIRVARPLGLKAQLGTTAPNLKPEASSNYVPNHESLTPYPYIL